MKFTVISNLRSHHQVAHQNAMAAGLSAHGIDPIISAGYANTKHVACWGWRHGKALRDAGHEVLVMERGYIGDRFFWSSLAWNGLNGYGEFPQADAEERFSRMGCIKPWKDGGDYVLIMGQVPADMSLRGKNLVPWYEANAVLARDSYGLPVKFRPHPVSLKKGHNVRPRHCEICTTKTLEDSLAGAAVVITYNSNSAVDSVLAGIPALSMDPGSMAYEVTGHKVGDIIKPDRDSWAERLAHCQWSLDEIQSGHAVGKLLSMKGLIKDGQLSSV